VSEPSKATQLLTMAMDQFRFGCDRDGKPFAVERAGPNVALALRGRGSFRSALAHAYFVQHGQAPGQNPLSEALAVIEGMAMIEQREPVAVRMGTDSAGRLIVDLARADGKAIVIEPGSWTVVDRSPVLFRSTEVIGELPVPEAGGSLEELFELVNIAVADRPVLTGCLVASLFSDLAHPIVFFSGEQGTAKSWVSRLYVRTFDGADADVQAAPRSLNDWAVLASASWSVAIDNVSWIDPWFSDALCRASTGARTLKRALYSDDAVAVLRVKRVIALNGIDPEVAGGDLAERLVRFDLEPVRGRLTDEYVAMRFENAHPKVLGALCDLTAAVLSRLPKVEVPNPPRMASFARVLAAVDAVMGNDGLGRYRNMVESQLASTVEASGLVQALERMVGDYWMGTASDLLTLLRRDEDISRVDLPKTPQGVGMALSRAAPGLRAGGWRVEQHRSAKARIWTLERVKGSEKEEPSCSSDVTFTLRELGDNNDGSAAVVPLHESCAYVSENGESASEFEQLWSEGAAEDR
jgi:hypothetical protein